jgi:hypothetical protein
MKHKYKIDQTTMASFFSVKAEVRKPQVSSNLKALASQQLVMFVPKDVAPFETATGDGFIEMTQFLIDVRD